MTAPKSEPRLAGRGLGETWRGVNPRSHYTAHALQIRRLPAIVHMRRPSTVRAS